MTEAYFGGGCFWCTEAIFSRLAGVRRVVSGYAGGETKDPTYAAVSSGLSGHAEVVKIVFDRKIITYRKLLEVFFELHDPTTVNRQGADVGSEYRSLILFANEDQKQKAKDMIKKLNKEKFEGKVVTEVKAFDKFYKAENYHKNYYQKNEGNLYCNLVISPKLKYLEERFKSKLKK